ncbi:MAG: STM4013/SEN3800 family hydrolase, partial [Planctomycetaceae bacterium]|nr:STM4013/SEN3800 family hydrolase [Planctomycetaceae bacterium]
MNANELIGTHDVLMITLDTLRYDVAKQAMEQGATPHLQSWVPGGRWEERHSPGNFTYAAHQAFFAGFLPTPAQPGRHPRLFATAFPGSETTTPETCVFDSPDIVSGLAERGYHTICIGGVGFFNKLSPLGRVLPNLFRESYWSEEMGVTSPHSTEVQVRQALACLGDLPSDQRAFLFLNISALHQPNCLFSPGATEDSPATQAAALAYVDHHLPLLFQAMRERAPVLCV